MWYSCNCTNCDQNDSCCILPSKNVWIDKNSFAPQSMSPFQDLVGYQFGDQHHLQVQGLLKRSSTMGGFLSIPIGNLPRTTAKPVEDRKVVSKLKAASDSVEEYSPANDSIEEGKNIKNQVMNSWEESEENLFDANSHKISSNSRKSKYSDTELRPDSSLPPVIRRRNQNRRKQLAASLLDGNSTPNNLWDNQQLQPNDKQQQHQQQQQPIINNSKLRSQSVSEDQWNQMVALNGPQPPLGFSGGTTASEVGGVTMTKRPYNTISGQIRPFGRGMVSSASVCDLNTLNQQHQQHQQQQQQHPHHHPAYPNIHSANSFQQLSVMSYDPNMVWMQPQPSPCTLCQTPQVFPQALGPGGMKRTTSNISMNLSTVGSDVTGYPWPHVHHHMPMAYPGYYPGYHQHMVPPGFPQGSAMSIPDSMKSYNRMPASPAPSARSSSHRSHKSSKSRSYNAADAGRRSRNHSRKRSEETEESDSSSFSDDQELPVITSKGNKPSGLAWQCDHCTFINPGHVQSCGMCSKVPVKTGSRTSRKGFEKRKSDKRKDKKEADSGENANSDYENEQRKDIRTKSRLKSSGSVKSSSGKSKKKSKRRESSLSRSSSGSGSDDEDEGVNLERQLIELRLTSRSRAGEYDGCSVTSRTKEKDRGSLKKEGKHGYRKRVL